MGKTMKKLLLVSSLVAATQFAVATAATAATCADRTHVVTQLQNRFGETLQAVSAMRMSAVMEIYASQETESWTVMVSLPKRRLTCLVASGRGFTSLNARFPATRHAARLQ